MSIEKNTMYFRGSFIYVMAMVAALGGFLFGYDTGIISGALLFLRGSFHPSIFMQEVIVSSVVLGALFGAIGSGRLADRYGRRMMLLSAAVMFIIGSIFTVFSIGMNFIIIGRFIIGIAIGISSYTVPLYLSELASRENRGALVMINAIAITGGEAISYLVDYGLVNTHSWRLMFATSILPAVLLFIGMLYMPETPRWLILNGRKDEARLLMKWLSEAKSRMNEYREIIHSINIAKPSWGQLFNRKLLPMLLIGIALGIFQQFVGINTVMYYGPIIFQRAGFGSNHIVIFATFGLGLVNTIMSIVALLLVDRIGRRKLLIGGLLVAAVSLGVLSATFIYGQNLAWVHAVTLLAMVCYISGYCLSVGSLFWLIISEIYPLRVRGLAMSLVTAIQWGANFIVAITFLSLLHKFGSGITFLMYGVISVIACVFCYKYVPETKSISLEEIETKLMQADSSELERMLFDDGEKVITG